MARKQTFALGGFGTVAVAAGVYWFFIRKAGAADAPPVLTTTDPGRSDGGVSVATLDDALDTALEWLRVYGLGVKNKNVPGPSLGSARLEAVRAIEIAQGIVPGADVDWRWGAWLAELSGDELVGDRSDWAWVSGDISAWRARRPPISSVPDRAKPEIPKLNDATKAALRALSEYNTGIDLMNKRARLLNDRKARAFYEDVWGVFTDVEIPTYDGEIAQHKATGDSALAKAMAWNPRDFFWRYLVRYAPEIPRHLRRRIQNADSAASAEIANAWFVRLNTLLQTFAPSEGEKIGAFNAALDAAAQKQADAEFQEGLKNRGGVEKQSGWEWLKKYGPWLLGGLIALKALDIVGPGLKSIGTWVPRNPSRA